MTTTRFKDHLLTGSTGSRPAASAVPAGTLYASSSDGNIYQSDGTSTWATWVTAGTGVSSGAVTLLSTNTIAGSAAAFDVSSISGSYNDLLLMLIGRASFSANTDNVMLRFNNDSGSNYASELATATGTGTTAAFEQTSSDRIYVGDVPAASATSGFFGILEMLIPGYASTTWNKTVISHGGWHRSISVGGARAATMGAGVWASTAAITRVQLLINDSPNTFVIGSQLRIYGRT